MNQLYKRYIKQNLGVNIIKKKLAFIIMLLFVFVTFSSCFFASPDKYIRQTQEAPQIIQKNSADAGETESELNDSAHALMELGIIAEDNYKTNNYLSRLVAVQLISDITGLAGEAEKSEYTHPFIDLTGNSEKEISYLYYNGIIDGVSNNEFMEDGICDLDTFLVFLIKGLSFIGGQQSDADIETAKQIAVDRGIISSEKENCSLSVNEAFKICENALYSYIDKEHTLLSYLSRKGIAQISDDNFDQIYEIYGPDISPFFKETFDDKVIDKYNIEDKYGKVYWIGSKVEGTDNEVTRDGCLELGGDEQNFVENQQISLEKKYMQENESYGMTFTVNIQCMGNEGDEERVIFRVIPRTADKEFTEYYAVNYYMSSPDEYYAASLVGCKWSITNTNAPSGTEPLAEAYYLLKENVDYTARLLIENTEDENVHIEFFIEGANHIDDGTEPLLEYTDTSEYKIMESSQGPAFGNSGYQDFGWGYCSYVRFDDIKLYDTQSFKKQTQSLKEYESTLFNLDKNENYFSQFEYLIKNGIIKPYQRNLDFSSNVSVEQFLATAKYLNGIYMTDVQTLEEFVMPEYNELFEGLDAGSDLDLSRPITRYEASLIIQNMMKGYPDTYRYKYLFNDSLNEDYSSSVYFAVQNSYILLDDNNNFNGDSIISRSEMLEIFVRAVDASLRNKNYWLSVPCIYSDYAVLQRDKPIPITGKGMSGDTVTVEINGQEETAEVIDGEWAVELNSMPAGGPYTLTIKDSGFTYTYNDVYIGEVFVLAGQSNIEWPLYDADNNEDALKEFNDQTKVRLFRPSRIRSVTPAFDTEAKWEVAFNEYSEHIMGGASAVGVFYIQKLIEMNTDLIGVRIGIVQITYGGTSIEMFLPGYVDEVYNSSQEDDEFISSGFWNGYMDFIAPYAAKALIYYQGENSEQLRYQYEPLLRDYIKGVREAFYDTNLPVMLVQLTGYGVNYGQDNDSWPIIREIQRRVANTIENVGLVTAIDLSAEDPLNIHPTNKRPIGERLAYLAMDTIYGKTNEKQSPTITDYELVGNVYRLSFDAQEIYFNEEAYGDIDFEVLNSEDKWVSAQAEIEGSTLLIWDDDTASPQGARYAWANYPKAILYNEWDLPILPFNTTKDLYKIITNDYFTTDEYHLKKAYHFLSDNDYIINLSRNNQLRIVKMANAYLLEYTEKIEGQSPGDSIVLLKRQADAICESGTTPTTVVISDHNLEEGDWILNNKYDELREVLEVVDENTVRVDFVENQAGGNIFEVYKKSRQIMAQE